MFTGIIEDQGRVVSVDHHPASDSATLVLTAPRAAEGLELGGSLAVNGVCLTAVHLAGSTVHVDVMGETLARTTTGALAPGDTVNLERCVPAGGRLDGHVVQGHVDGVGVLLERTNQGDWDSFRFSVPAGLSQFLAEKGSIAVDGVSLTVTAVSTPTEVPQWFEVGLIPTTLAHTGLGTASAGRRVNLEVDVLAKYAARRGQFSVADLLAAGAGSADRPLLDPVPDAVAALARGEAILVVDDEDRENEGDIIFAAQHSTPALLGWTIRYSSGVLCVPMTDERADALALPAMVLDNQDAKRTAYTISTDAATGVSTGISASDRARTAAVLADPATTPADLTRPGHMFPLRAVPGGVRERAGHTEAAVELCRLAGCEPVGVIAEVVDDEGQMVRLPGLRRFADEHGLALISIADLVAHLVDSENGVLL